MKLYSACALLLVLLVVLPLQAAHPFLCCDHNGGKVCVVSAEGKIEWEYACKSPQDCWRLANGNYLFCFFSGAVEVTPSNLDGTDRIAFFGSDYADHASTAGSVAEAGGIYEAQYSR